VYGWQRVRTNVLSWGSLCSVPRARVQNLPEDAPSCVARDHPLSRFSVLVIFVSRYFPVLKHSGLRLNAGDYETPDAGPWFHMVPRPSFRVAWTSTQNGPVPSRFFRFSFPRVVQKKRETGPKTLGKCQVELLH